MGTPVGGELECARLQATVSGDGERLFDCAKVVESMWAVGHQVEYEGRLWDEWEDESSVCATCGTNVEGVEGSEEEGQDGSLRVEMADASSVGVAAVETVGALWVE